MPKVFLIDTEPHISALLTSRFEQEGFEVLPFGLNQVSSEALSLQRPDLVVFGRGYSETDPTISSFQDLMKLGGTGSVPIILLTASDTESFGDAQQAIAQIKMPFRPSQLLELARKAVASA